MLRTTRRRLSIVLTAATATLAFGAACGGGPAEPTRPAGEGEPPTETAPAEIIAACPLVDVATVESTFDVQGPQATENDPVATGPATTYSCDFSDAGELFVTVGVAVAPVSGTVEANVRAALSNATGEPVDGIGEGGAYAETDGVGTAAGVKTVGSDYRLVFVHGAAGSKDQIVALAREATANA